MDASHNKPQAGVLPTTPMPIGNIPQYPVRPSRPATFNTRNVTREDNLPCQLTVYLDSGHSFVRLENKDREVDIARGMYPVKRIRKMLRREGGMFVSQVDRNQCPVEKVKDPRGVRSFYLVSAVSGAVRLAVSQPLGRVTWAVGGGKFLYQNLFEKKQAKVVDEAIIYRDYYRIHNLPKVSFDHLPKVTFSISQREALRVEKYISEYDDACNKGEESCSYKGLGFNCVDFSQEVFSKTDYPGHFIQYFTPSLLSQEVGYATAYAVGYHPVVKNNAASIGVGTLMLATLVGKYVVPKLTETARSVGSWMCGWVWPEQQPVAVAQVNESELKELHSSVKDTNESCEKFWEYYKERDSEAKKLISDSVDLQARFDDVEELIKTEGYSGRHQSFISKELEDIQDGFTRFFRQAAEMKNAKNSRG